MWKLSCSQSREHEEQIATLEAEVERLKASKSGEALSAGSLSLPGSLSGRSSPTIPEPEMAHVSVKPTRRGKVPPVDPFTEDPAVKLEDWLPVFKESTTLEQMVTEGRANPAIRTLERLCSSGMGSS